MKAFNVTHLANKQACKRAENMYHGIRNVIREYDDELPLPLALGVLDIVKKELIEEHE